MAIATVVISPVAFTMHGAREAIAGGMPHIEEQVKAIEQAVVENAGLAFDLAKTLIESACRTILTERQTAFGDVDELPKLFKAVTQALPFLPPGSAAEGEVRKSLDKTLTGLNTTLQGVCELRNECGFASHGKDGPAPVMETMQAILVAQAADAIVGFIFRAHRQAVAGPPAPMLEYDDNPEFNALINETHDRVRIFGLEYDPSEVLFNVDIEAYRDRLAGFNADLETAAREGGDAAPAPAAAAPAEKVASAQAQPAAAPARPAENVE
jgi:hypothetical protein